MPPSLGSIVGRTHLSPVVCHIQTARWDQSQFGSGPARCLTLFIQGLAFLAFGLNLVDLDAPSIGVAILEPTPKILQRTKTSPF